MNAIRKSCLLVTGLFMLAPALADDAELKAVQIKVADQFDAIEPEDISRSPVDGWYTIQKGSIVAYVSADGRYLLQGDLIDLDENVNLSEVSRSDARRELLASMDEGQVITFSPSEVQYSVTIFTDVDCGYCQRLHAQIDEYMALGIEVRYMLYPRNGPASPAWGVSEQVWCASNRQEALTAAKLDREFSTNQCDASMVSQHYVAGQQVGLSGTPAIVLSDGELIGGYLPPQQLKARLDQKFTQ